MKRCVTCGQPNINNHVDPPEPSIHDDCQDCSIQKYISERQRNGYSHEELFEMKATFGEGTEIVDVFTGKTITL